MEPMRMAIAKVAARVNLTGEEISMAMEEIMEGGATPAQIGAFLMGLRMKGETVDEIAGAARVMRSKALRVEVDMAPWEPLVDTCGTGGSGTYTFNVSTTGAFVVAGAGIKVAKHGNRAVSSRSGSADVLEALGVNLALTPRDVARAVRDVGIGFLFAPALHPAMKHAIGPRREIGLRTIFNVLGPLTNPAGATVQVLGVYDPALTGPLAEVLGRLGSRRAWVVHGEGGLDELSLLGTSAVAEWDGETVREFRVAPGDVGLAPCTMDALRGGDAGENARIVERLLSGEPGPKRDMVLLNAGAAIFLAGGAESLGEGVRRAAEAIDSGAALERLRALIRFSRSA